uniref:AAA+ ATPase domain-containing protein n=1 Tax=Chromera velia CCMP2878 TaxID=1169474 RepID=A0A0G4HCT0_9ALVE|eukprot:Cvel_6370.t1-p1 / transcript=Cvel_6370.t1 / gene=Cvel_6370 / organism=Chromera_velia_CCMP2878 / gene_product=E3 ubiquitin-protein ligase RNF213, putative / transcript_product=E3 ubiquitin-protein ligase RNF213, putative / location=Cvel_scaffold310:12946-19871(-) / protein_length=1148 / sequence_SO=supercontig / SO=protein_coding / is_pseudo=false
MREKSPPSGASRGLMANWMDGSNLFGTRLKWPSSRQKAVFLLNLLDGGAAFEWRGREIVRGELKPDPASAFIVTVVEAGHPNRMNPFFSVYPAGFQGRSGPRDDVEALVSILTTAQQFHAFGPPARSPDLRSWDDLVTVCFKELDFIGKDMPLRPHHFLSDFIKKFGDHPLHLMRLLRPPYLPFDKNVSDVVHRMQPGPAEWNLIKGRSHELTTFFSENIQVWCSIIVRSFRDDACPACVQCAVYAFLIRALLKGAGTITRETFPEDYDPALLDPDVLEEVVRDRSPGTSAVASLLVEVWPASILQEKVEGLLVSQGGQERLSDLLLGVLARLQKVTRDVDGVEKRRILDHLHYPENVDTSDALVSFGIQEREAHVSLSGLLQSVRQSTPPFAVLRFQQASIQTPFVDPFERVHTGRDGTRALLFDVPTRSLLPPFVVNLFNVFGKRRPAPFEVCILNREVTEACLKAFIQRWQQSRVLNLDLLFVMMIPEDVSGPLLSALKEELSAVQAAVTRSDTNLIPARRLMRQRLVGSASVSVWTTANPAEGKTRAILLHKSGRPGNEPAYHRISIDRDPTVRYLGPKLQSLARARRTAQWLDSVKVHLSIGHAACLPELSESLFSLFVLGHLGDSQGRVFRLRAVDHVAIELPSERCPKDFFFWQALPIVQTLAAPTRIQTSIRASLPRLQAVKNSEDLLYTVARENDTVLLQVISILKGFLAGVDQRVFPDSLPEVARSEVDLVLRAAMCWVLRDTGRSDEDIEKLTSSLPMRCRFAKMMEAHASPLLHYFNNVIAALKNSGTGVRRGLLEASLSFFHAALSRLFRTTESTLASMLMHMVVNLVLRTTPLLVLSTLDPPTTSSLAEAEADHYERFSKIPSFESDEFFKAYIVFHDDSYSLVSLHDRSLMTELLQTYPESRQVAEFKQWFHRGHPLSDDLIVHGWESLDKLQSVIAARDALSFQEATASSGRAVAGNRRSRGRTPKDFRREAKSVLERIRQENVTITLENLMRMLAITVRLRSGMVVSLSGETRCGKTKLIEFFCLMLRWHFFVANIHGGMDSGESFEGFFKIKAAISKAKRDPSSLVVLFLDEANASPATWAVKEMGQDKFLCGRKLPDNLRVIIAMNPIRVKKSAATLRSKVVRTSRSTF